MTYVMLVARDGEIPDVIDPENPAPVDDLDDLYPGLTETASYPALNACLIHDLRIILGEECWVYQGLYRGEGEFPQSYHPVRVQNCGSDVYTVDDISARQIIESSRQNI